MRITTTATHTFRISDNTESGTVVLTATTDAHGGVLLEVTDQSPRSIRLDGPAARTFAAWLDLHIPAPVGSGDQI